jgi:heat shock protein HslJ
MNTYILQKIAVIMLVVSVLFTACVPFGGQKNTIDLDPLYTGTWHLAAYGNDDGISIVTPGLRTFINFKEDGNLSGNAGCNNFFGTFDAKKDGSFTVGEPIGATLMFCESFMDEESAFLAALQSAERLEFNEVEQLVIRFSDAANGHDFMLFVNQVNVPLLGTGWVLGSLVGPDGEIAIPPASAPLLSFSEDGSLSGSGGCNRLMSGFTIEGNTISINEFASSMMYCDGLMDLEDRFTAGLEQVSRYEIVGDRLVLSDDAYTNVLTFFAADFMLSETQWQLQLLNGESIPEDLLVTLTLSSDDNHREGIVFGSTGCNRFSGTYTMDGDRVNINVLVVTVIMCDFGMETETAFLAALQDPMTYQIEFNRLVLVSETNALVFLGQKPSLAGLWRAITLGDPQNPVEMTFDQTILAEFIIEDGANTGLISGMTPCQDYAARYFVDRDNITIRLQEINQFSQCLDGSELDTQFFDALQKTKTYDFHRRGLILRDAEGNQVLEFTQQ